MRIPVLCLALIGCAQADTAAPGELVQCALGGSQLFKSECRIERAAVDGDQVIVVRHPDGAFHRLQVSDDGQKLVSADGFEQAQSALKGDRFEVILGQDRYVIPAKPKVDAAKP